MPKSVEDIQKISQTMIEANAERNKAFFVYDLMDHNLWDLPEAIRNLPWVLKVKSSDPHDAINTATRILSTLPHTIRYLPMGPGANDKARANMIERILDWEMRSLNRRRSASVAADVSRSAIKYSAVAAQVIDLDYQILQKKEIQASTEREEFIRQYSRFVVKTHHPGKIHVRQSDFMPEEVLLADVRDAKNVIDEWGMRASKLMPLTEIARQERDRKVMYFDYTKYNQRLVWCTPMTFQAQGVANPVDQSMIILNDYNPPPFLNWVALMGGTTLEDDPVHKYQPILYAVYTSGAWEVQNIVETLMVSEGIARSGSPRFKEEGPSSQESQIDWQSPDRIAKVPPQNTLTELRGQELDRALSDIHALFAGKVDKATVSRILQGGDVPAGVAFATLNLATQTAVGVLKPYKDLSEKGLSEIYALMLQWINFTKAPLMAYGTGKKDLGKQYTIDPNEIDPGAIYIECELHPDVPIDKQQRINAASMAVETLDMSVETALDDIGIADPRGEIKNRMKERLLRHMIDLRMEEDRQRMEMQLELEMQQQLAAFQQPPQAQPLDLNQTEEFAQGGAQPTMGGAFPGGQGFNTAMGGEPPSLANPAGTREMIQGQDMMGNELGGLI